jgi:hypothetical protein
MRTDDEFRRDLILVSALFHAPAPRDRIYANCFRVLRHALNAAGLWDREFAAAFHGDDEELARFPLVAQWYSTLIDLTRRPESERLLEGGGNLGDPPSGAYFTACWLTPAGKMVAEQLLAEHPEWKDRVTARAEGQHS